jgi:hypothetical protein
MLGVVTVDSTVRVGDILAELEVQPVSFNGTRLTQVAHIWSRWRPNALKFRIVSSAASIVSGNYMAAWTAAYDKLGSGMSAVREMATFVPTTQQHISQSATVNVPCTGALMPSQRWLSVHRMDEMSDCAHGRFLLVATAQVANIKGSVTLTIHLDWDVTFSNPQIDRTDEGYDTVYARDGYEGYHTTSSSDWHDSAYLSFKHTAGGAFVPFDGAQPGIVYELAPTAKCSMYINSNTLVPVGYAVRIKDDTTFDYPTFTPFPRTDKGREYAEAYAKTGDLANLYRYYAAGEPVTPTNPPWKPLVDTRAVRTLVNTGGDLRTQTKPVPVRGE